MFEVFYFKQKIVNFHYKSYSLLAAMRDLAILAASLRLAILATSLRLAILAAAGALRIVELIVVALLREGVHGALEGRDDLVLRVPLGV